MKQSEGQGVQSVGTNTEFAALIEAYMVEQKKGTVKKYKVLNQCVKKGRTLFVGSSLMEWFPISELQLSLDEHYHIYNRGIAGSVTDELLYWMDECIFELEPSKIFINIGTNDMNTSEYRLEKLIANYDNILSQIKTRLPSCQVYVMAYYPINAKADFGSAGQLIREAGMFKTRTNEVILQANDALKSLAEKHHYEFINVNQGLTDETGNLKEEFSIDGIHMYANGYSVVLGNLVQYL